MGINPNFQNRTIASVLAGAGTSVIMAAVILLILLGPKPYPPLREAVKPGARPDGMFRTTYWLGLLKEEWNYQGGLPEGPAFQFYPNGSLYRRLEYARGRLEGEVKEYYEKPGRARGISRRYIPRRPPQIKLGAGTQKAVWTYRGGVREGPYVLYYENGRVKEEGDYRQGKLHGFIRGYSKTGALLSERLYENGKKVDSRSAALIMDNPRN